MRARVGYLMCVLAAVAATARCGEPRSCVLIVRDAPAIPMSGNPRIDFASLPGGAGPLQEAVQDAAEASRKSPWLAAGMSLVIPGAGEFYTDRYLKTGIFIAVEAALWILANAYDDKGNRQTDFFQNYANAHWSVVAYVQYAQKTFSVAQAYQVINPGYGNYPPWMQINWNALNQMEQAIGATDAGSYYSHILPAYNTQQYYELIGKYPQFNQGWDDAPPSFAYGGIRSTEALWYDGQRGQANTYYTTASTFVGIALVNHVVSAVDAAFSAGSYNKGLHASVETRPVPTLYGGYTAVPVVHLAWGF